MRSRLTDSIGRPRAVHPYQALWEPLETSPTFTLRAMFGTKAAYLDGKLMLCFSAKAEPWRGVLVCTAHEHHAALRAAFPELTPHPILPKWLYLPETADRFERVAAALVELARRRDPRLGVAPKPRQRRTKISGRPPAPPRRPRSR